MSALPGTSHFTGRAADVIIEIPTHVVGLIIGKAGANIRDLQARSGAEIWVETSDDPINPASPGQRRLFMIGSSAQCNAARTCIVDLLMSHRVTALAFDQGTPESRAQIAAAIQTVALPEASAAPPSAPPIATPGATPADVTGCGATAAAAAAAAAAVAAAAAAAPVAEHATEEVRISSRAFAMLLEPSMPVALAELRASGLHIHFSRSRLVSAASRKRPRIDDGNREHAATARAHASAGAGSVGGGGPEGEGDYGSTVEGARLVRLTGNPTALRAAKTVLARCEAHAAAARALDEQRVISEEEALYQYYQPHYARAGLTYTQPTRLWQDEVDAEAERYRMWALYYQSYYARGGQPDATHMATHLDVGLGPQGSD